MGGYMALEERGRRLQTLAQLREAHIDPYPARLGAPRTPIHEVLDRFEQLVAQKESVGIAGRVRLLRSHGKATFFDIEDGSAKIQCYAKADVLKDAYHLLKSALVALGDIVFCRGVPFTTKKGERTLEVQSLTLLTKSLRPLPEKWHGLSDVEERYRKRSLDFLVNPQTRAILKIRARILEAIRMFFNERGYLEVETPILQSIAGGATARPFLTHHNALDIPLQLRIAPELYLKRLLVGGFERVFEIARCFRNEGIDREHNPEFTQVESYEAFADYRDYMTLVERLFESLLDALGRGKKIAFGKRTIAFAFPLPRVSYVELLAEHSGIDVLKTDRDDVLFREAQKKRLPVESGSSRAKIIDELFKTFVRPKMVDPVFVVDYPIELSPLTKRHPENAKLAERFQLLIAGMEMVNAFSELNDPTDQRERFEAQAKMRQAGDSEAQQFDEDFIQSLEYGMPPAAGLGLGIDRLTALLTNSHSIKEVIAFPLLRPKGTS